MLQKSVILIKLKFKTNQRKIMLKLFTLVKKKKWRIEHEQSRMKLLKWRHDQIGTNLT